MITNAERKKLPLLQWRGIGEARAITLRDDFGVLTLDDLRQALRDGPLTRVESVRGLPVDKLRDLIQCLDEADRKALAMREQQTRAAEAQREKWAWEVFATTHPHGAHRAFPERFWQFFRERVPHATREQMVQWLDDTQELRR